MKELIQQPHILLSVENAFHPASSPISHEEAIEALSQGGSQNVISAQGKYGNPERTILISNPTDEQTALAHQIAEQSGQDSVLSSDGMSHKIIYVNGSEKGKIEHGKGTTFHEQPPEDFYTTLPSGESFTHNFAKSAEADKKVSLPRDEFIREHKKLVEVLRSPSHKDDVKEADEQEGELASELEKSKNVREQRKKVFGTDANAPRISDKRMKMMQQIQDYAQKKYGLPMTTGSGKRTMSGQLRDEKGIEQEPFDVFTPQGHKEEKARQAKVKQLGLKRVDPKPDWRSGKIETQPSPDAAVHELAHIDLAPENMTLPQFQVEMDRRHGQNQKDFGYMQNKRTSHEIQPMAIENPIRRELGLPANRATKPVKQNEPVKDMPSEKRFVEAKNPKTGSPMYLDRQSRLQVPETRERVEQIREGSLKFNPQKGWEPSSAPDALVNLRGRGKLEEAKARAKARFAGSSGEAQPAQSQPSLDDLLNHQGSVEELKQKIAQFAGAQKPTKMAASEKMGKAVELNHYFVQYKPVVNDSKNRNLDLPKPKKMAKARVDQGLSIKEKETARSARNYREEDENSGKITGSPRHAGGGGVHTPFAGRGRSIAGHAARGNWSYGSPQKNREMFVSEHKKVTAQGSKVNPKLPDIKKARQEEGYSSRAKLQIRHSRSEKPNHPYGTTDRMHPEGKNTPMGQRARANKLREFKKQPPKDLGKAISLEHYSAVQGLKQIDPAFKGKGVDSRTKGRDTEHPHSFFYRANTQPEDVVAGGAKSKYAIELPDETPLYDLSLDKENHIHNAIQENNGALNMDMVHSKLKDAGYAGFYNSSHPQLSNVIAMYHPQEVSSEQEMGKSRSYFDLSRKEKKDKLAREEYAKKNPNPISAEDAHKEALQAMLKPKTPKAEPKKEEGKIEKWSDCDDKLAPLSKPKKA